MWDREIFNLAHNAHILCAQLFSAFKLPFESVKMHKIWLSDWPPKKVRPAVLFELWPLVWNIILWLSEITDLYFPFIIAAQIFGKLVFSALSQKYKKE